MTSSLTQKTIDIVQPRRDVAPESLVALNRLDGTIRRTIETVEARLGESQKSIVAMMASIKSVERDVTRMLVEAATKARHYPLSIYTSLEADRIETAASPDLRAMALTRASEEAARRLAKDPDSVGWRTSTISGPAGDMLRDRVRLLADNYRGQNDLVEGVRVDTARKGAMTEVTHRVETVLSTGYAPSDGMIAEMTEFAEAISTASDVKAIADLKWAIVNQQPLPAPRHEVVSNRREAPALRM